MVVNVVQVPPSNDNNIWLLGGWSYVADSATHLVSVALVSVLGRGVRNDVWFWMLDQGEQRQQQALLDILPRVGSEVVDIPHDSLSWHKPSRVFGTKSGRSWIIFSFFACADTNSISDRWAMRRGSFESS